MNSDMISRLEADQAHFECSLKCLRFKNDFKSNDKIKLFVSVSERAVRINKRILSNHLHGVISVDIEFHKPALFFLNNKQKTVNFID